LKTPQSKHGWPAVAWVSLHKTMSTDPNRRHRVINRGLFGPESKQLGKPKPASKPAKLSPQFRAEAEQIARRAADLVLAALTKNKNQKSIH
jgi:hypothetical protein